MEITTSLAQGRVPVTVVHLKGNFDSTSIETFNREINRILGSGAKDILLEMSGVAFMSSVGIRAISNLFDQLHHTDSPQEKKAVIEASKAGTYRAPHLKLCGLHTHLREVIDLVNLDKFLEIFPTEEQAVAAF